MTTEQKPMPDEIYVRRTVNDSFGGMGDWISKTNSNFNEKYIRVDRAETQAVDLDALKRESIKAFNKVKGSKYGFEYGSIEWVIDHLASRDLIRGEAEPVNKQMLDALKETDRLLVSIGTIVNKSPHHERIKRAITAAEQCQQDTETIPNNWRELLKLSQNNFQHNFGMKPFKLGADWVYKDLEELFSSTGRYEHCVDKDTVAIPSDVLGKVLEYVDENPLHSNTALSDLLKPYVKGGE
jgi:hypothetical protein